MAPSILRKIAAVFLAFVLALAPAFAYAFSLFSNSGERIDEAISRDSYTAIFYGGIIFAVLLFISFKVQPTENNLIKRFVFTAIVIIVGGVTLFMALSTIYLNRISSSGGPVHWHADFLVSKCGNDVDLINPTGLSNKIGTPVLHEHADNRIHVEGVVIDPDHVSIAEFFNVIGGSATLNELSIPTEDGLEIIKNGQTCPNDQIGNWQVFLYKTDILTGLVTQRKLEDFPNYILSPYSTVPPGDCIIFEFTDQVKDKTDRICNFYEIELEKGNIRLGDSD